MPAIVNKQKTFLQGLSDFWPIFFKDTIDIETYLEGVQITSGQLYLKLLETVLGTNLEFMPLFTKDYFRYITIREDKMRYIEGQQADLDTYNFQLDTKITDIKTLINKIVLPTNCLQKQYDYLIKSSQLSFFKNPYTNLTNFPIRNVTIQDPAIYYDLSNKEWPLVKLGDTFAFRLTTGTLSESIITGNDLNKLSFETTNNNFGISVARKDFETFILRTPWDSPKLGTETNNYFIDSFSSEGIVHIAASVSFSLLGSPKWKGNWTTTTNYSKGDFVNNAGVVYIAKEDHTSGVLIGPEFESIDNYLLYYYDPDDFGNNGLYIIISSGIGLVSALNRVSNFGVVGATPKINNIGKLSDTFFAVAPYTQLINTFITRGTLRLDAKRSHSHIVNGVVYPALQDVIEEIDYSVDYEKGLIYFKTIWEPLKTINASYEWRALIDHRIFKYKGSWSNVTSYLASDIVVYNNEYYCAIQDNINKTPFNSPTYWRKFVSPFEFNKTRTVKEIALWGTDVLIDEESLYSNFGYLLAEKRDTSEQYREFLRGIAQLFLLGPTFEKFESALNVVSGFPIIRDSDEILRNYDSGIFASGNTGQIIDISYGRNGTLTQAGNLFDSPTANFFPSDVGAVIRVLVNSIPYEYVVTAVNSSTQAVVTPLIPADATNVVWNYEHINLNKRFRVPDGTYQFTQEDVNSLIWIEDPSNDRNKGFFNIVSVENSTTVILASPFSLVDEINISWKLSRTKKQRVTTSQQIYDFNLDIPIRSYVKDSNNFNVYIFRELEALTDAYEIVDYIKDSTWFHKIAIPEDVLRIYQNDIIGRRQVSEKFIEHIVNPQDNAVLGDFGLICGFDDQNETRIVREGPANWFGGDTIVLNFATGVEVARVRDVGTYLTIEELGTYKILGIDVTGTIIKLEHFEPTLIPPQAINVRLPTIIYRRTVPFVMFDTFLKYHSLQVKINPIGVLGQDLLAEIIDLIKEAKPSFKYIYLEPVTSFRDELTISEDFTIGLGLSLIESIRSLNNLIIVGPPTNLQAGDAYRFETQSNLIPAAPGTYPFAPVLPAGGRFYVVKARFDQTVLVNGGTRKPVEGTDYLVNYSNGDVTILPGSSFVGINTFYFVLAILRTRTLLDPLDPYETRLAVAGADPTTTHTFPEIALIDRAVQINIS